MSERTELRVALYTRISTDETNQPYSLGAQRDRLEAYVATQPGWRIVARYVDQASGKSLERPGLAAARRAAARGEYDLLLAYRVDRLSRNLAQLGKLVEELAALQVGFRSATEPFDSSTAPGRMMLQMLGVFAEFERASIVERITMALERKAQRGEWTVGGYPFGYAKTPGELMLRPDPATAAIVSEIFRRYADDRLGSGQIASELNARGLRTNRGRPWSRTAVLAVLRSRTYLGEIPHRGGWYPGGHPAVVERALFDRAQLLLRTRARRPALRRSNPSEYLLSGLPLVCERCGHHFVGTAAYGRAHRRYTYYTCYTRSRYGRSHCDQARIPKDELEQAILAQMGEVYRDTPLLAAAIAEAGQKLGLEREERSQQRAARVAERADVERRMDRYFAAFEAGTLTPEVCRERVAQLRDRLAAIDEALVLLSADEPEEARPPVEMKLLTAFLNEALGLVLQQLPTPRAKAILALLIEEIRIASPSDIRPVYRIPSEVRIPADTVREGGLEPPRPFGHMALNHDRLPLRHSRSEAPF